MPHGLLGRLLYGTGMRPLEALRLRVKDIDFERRAILVRQGKNAKDRVVMLPAALEEPLRVQLARAHAVWAADRDSGVQGVLVPHALARKYPRATLSWAWHCAFPQGRLSDDPRGAGPRRHHLLEIACRHPTCTRTQPLPCRTRVWRFRRPTHRPAGRPPSAAPESTPLATTSPC
jgi:hypothetical protein